MDLLISDLLDYIEEQHAATNYERDPVKLAEAWGIRYEVGPRYLARSRDYDMRNDLICVTEEEYGSRHLFSVSHEFVHVLARRGGYIKLIRYYHASVPDMRKHIELIVNYGGGRLLMTAQDLYEATREFGDSPNVILRLMEVSGASEAAAMRRWSWQDIHEYRAAFTAQGNYIQDAVRCRARLPFKRGDRVPEIHIVHPDVNLVYLGDGRVMGTVV
ncbi:ImmA/IrrE family metallo-endopeptidase [Deinococcus hopiensis]|uniref:IrrE N-terminal-like domain-containing protein n=1 Tax=Deinococcus hopiensis KR-140 TaxID=695939 RepID=A0A1W1V6N5_9DEIO|nr:ImmA/IrrE family metallo-endopeptidase [Deinococcus hopiensis]SMB89109.1 protein of unknown function [Deinococcus hopiensis KR-140]